MYRITVKSTGKYDNAVIGVRYCFFKKSAKDLIDTFASCNCDFTVDKLIRLHSDVFSWSDYEDGDKVFDYYYEKI